MTRNNYIVSIAFVIIIITTTPCYAQKSGVAQIDENAIGYRYQQKTKKTIHFTTPKSFIQRSYLIVGSGIESLWSINNNESRAGYGLKGELGWGAWLTPVHGLEIKANIGVLPFNGWRKNLINNDELYSSLIKQYGFGVNYMFNLTNYAYQREDVSKLQFIWSVGAELKKNDNLSVGINTSIRAIVNPLANLGLFIEPQIHLYDKNLTKAYGGNARGYILPSISAGIIVRFDQLRRGNHFHYWNADNENVESNYKNLFAIKSNLLLWFVAAPNFSIEFPIKRSFSIGLSYMSPWFNNKDTGFTYQLMTGNVEGRYWFGNRYKHHQLTGYFAGIYAGAGYYDLLQDKSDEGKQGELNLSVGFTGGYAHAINKSGSLRLEYSIGVGIMQNNYRKYHWDGLDYVLDAPSPQSWHISRMGLTQAKVAIVWMLMKNTKKGGRK